MCAFKIRIAYIQQLCLVTLQNWQETRLLATQTPRERLHPNTAHLYTMDHQQRLAVVQPTQHRLQQYIVQTGRRHSEVGDKVQRLNQLESGFSSGASRRWTGKRPTRSTRWCASSARPAVGRSVLLSSWWQQLFAMFCISVKLVLLATLWPALRSCCFHRVWLSVISYERLLSQRS